jgi:hypothetical protein
MQPGFALSGAVGDGGRRILAPQLLAAPAGLTRAQVGSSAAALAQDGTSWTLFAADTPRFHGTGRALLVEGQRTNGVRNPRCEGAVAGVIGSGGAWPTYWVAVQAGLTAEVLGVVSRNGVACLRVKFTGTPTGTAVVYMDGYTAGLPVSTGATVTPSAFVSLVEGGLGGGLTAIRLWSVERDSGGSVVGTTGTTNIHASLNASLQRFALANDPISAATAATAQPGLALVCTAGVALPAGGITLDIGWPQVEAGALPSSPILPPAGAPATTTRGAELVTAATGSLFPTGAGTIALSGRLPVVAGQQALLQLHGGSDANRFAVIANAGTVSLVRTLGGVAQTVATGSIVGGQTWRLAMSFNAAGGAALSLNGGAAVTVTGGPTSGLSSLLVGATVSGGTSMFGEVANLATLPYVVPDAALPGFANAQPG